MNVLTTAIVLGIAKDTDPAIAQYVVQNIVKKLHQDYADIFSDIRIDDGYSDCPLFPGDNSISVETILTGKDDLKRYLRLRWSLKIGLKVKEKLQLELHATIKNRPFNQEEAENLSNMLFALDKNIHTAILQKLFIMKNNNELDIKWLDVLMEDKHPK